MSFITFNLGWWACALGASHQEPWIGPALAPLWVGLHIFYSPVAKGETIFLLLLSVIGFALDTLLIQLGLFATIPAQTLAPLWLVTMWILLGLTYESMLMMRRNRALLIISGAVSGPFAYYCTEAVNILHYARPLWLSLALHGLLWGALTPALMYLRTEILRRTEHKLSVLVVPLEPVAGEAVETVTPAAEPRTAGLVVLAPMAKRSDPDKP
jgi:hypothetical protein